MIPGLLRAGAIVIALAGVIDPSITSTRSSRPEISVVTAESSVDELANRVARDLADEFTVLRAPFSGAAGTVIVGDRLPLAAEQLRSPVFAVIPEPAGPTVSIQAVTAPARTAVDARVRVMVDARVRGARGRTLEMTLRANDLVVDRVSREVTSDDQRLQVSLLFVPTAVAAAPLRVTADILGEQRTVAADVVVDVRDQRWAVLFYDPRPSWMSTFVRRALERDPRFIVTSRIVTSRGISVDAGRPPSAFNDLNATSHFDAVVIGAPEALTDAEVTGLDAFLRRRGGGVVLLLDQRVDAAYDRLTNVESWADASRNVPVAVGSAVTRNDALRAAELVWPARLPAGAEAVALDSAGHSIVWRSAVGAGRLVVSGALDAWRFRDPAVSGFERLWQTLIAETADAAAPPIDIRIAEPLLQPGASTEVIVTLRDVALSDIARERSLTASLTATVESPTGRARLRLWPGSTPGEFAAAFRAPRTPGVYRIVVSSGGARADAPLVVAHDVKRIASSQSDLLANWVRSRSGTAIPSSRLDDLRPALARVLQPTPRRETWHPMRSGWWIIPFTMLLAAEWWWRRRRGLA